MIMEATFKKLSILSDQVSVGIQNTKEYTMKFSANMSKQALNPQAKFLVDKEEGDIVYDGAFITKYILDFEDFIIWYVLYTKKWSFERLASALSDSFSKIYGKKIVQVLYSNAIMSKIRSLLRSTISMKLNQISSLIEKALEISLNGDDQVFISQLRERISLFETLGAKNVSISFLTDDIFMNTLHIYSAYIPSNIFTKLSFGIVILESGSIQLQKSIFLPSNLNGVEPCYENKEGVKIERIAIDFQIQYSRIDDEPSNNSATATSSSSATSYYMWIIHQPLTCVTYYSCFSNRNSPFPPYFGWNVIGKGKYPPPKCDVQILNDPQAAPATSSYLKENANEIKLTIYREAPFVLPNSYHLKSYVAIGGLLPSTTSSLILTPTERAKTTRQKRNDRKLLFLAQATHPPLVETVSDKIKSIEDTFLVDESTLTYFNLNDKDAYISEMARKNEELLQVLTSVQVGVWNEIDRMKSNCEEQFQHSCLLQYIDEYSHQLSQDDTTHMELSFLLGAGSYDDDLLAESSGFVDSSFVAEIEDAWNLDTLIQRQQDKMNFITDDEFISLKSPMAPNAPSVAYVDPSTPLEILQRKEMNDDHLIHAEDDNSSSDSEGFFTPEACLEPRLYTHCLPLMKSAIRKQQIISAESKSTIKINSMINTNGIPSELNDMLDYATLKVCERRQKDEQPSMIEVLGLEMWPPLINSSKSDSSALDQKLHYVIRVNLNDKTYLDRIISMKHGDSIDESTEGSEIGRSSSCSTDSEIEMHEVKSMENGSDKIKEDKSQIYQKLYATYFQQNESLFSFDSRCIFTIRRPLHEIVALHSDLIAVLKSHSQSEISPPPFPDIFNMGILEEEYIQSLATPSKPPLSAIPSKVLIPPYVPHQHRGVLRVDQMYDNMGNKIFSHSKGGTNTSLVSVVGDIFKNAKQNNNFLKMISSNESSSEKTSKELEKLLQQSFLELERYLQCVFYLYESLDVEGTLTNENDFEKKSQLQVLKLFQRVIAQFLGFPSFADIACQAEFIHAGDGGGSKHADKLSCKFVDSKSGFRPCTGILIGLYLMHEQSPKDSTQNNDEILRIQKYRCLGCGEPLISGLFGIESNFYQCRYIGGLFCRRWCEGNTRRIIPSRVLQRWDVSTHRVSCQASQFLDSIWDKPILNISGINELLYEGVSGLSTARLLRRHCIELMQTCINHEQYHRVSSSITGTLGHRLYLAFTSDLYSLEDILNVHKGEMYDMLLAAVDCLQKIALLTLMRDEGHMAQQLQLLESLDIHYSNLKK